ncbi:MAG: SIS domain-containing protein, partial [archaeon YNP-WB-062]|nr:SIS domain-containing protein [Candidatus Culexarchaeum yellowstonense]
VATALEGRLKLLEITYTPSLAFSAAESKHGPISIVEKGVPVIFIAPRDSTRKEIVGNIMEMKARGAEVIALCEEDDGEIIGLADHHIPMPKGIPDILSPIPYIVPLQLFAYHVAVERGLDPDKPRNLAKSVTVP